MAAYLLLVLEAPLIAFGREAVDARCPVDDFPAASMLTGLFANALGWHRTERARHARLQARLEFAARLDRAGTRFTDFQTAQLGASDRGWTTRGAPEGRAGGANTYNAPHIRARDYDADKRVTVAVRLLAAAEAPTLDDLAAAIDTPARPLFIGRKPCLPTGRLLAGIVEADGLLAAVESVPLPEDTDRPTRIMLPVADAIGLMHERRWISDLRDWQSGVHAGGREVAIHTLPGAARI